MPLKIIILVISALLLVQSTLSHPNTAEIVVSTGTSTDLQNKNRTTLLHYAAEQIYAELNDNLSKTLIMFELVREHFQRLHISGENAQNELNMLLVRFYEFYNISKNIEKANEQELKICSVDLVQKFNFHQEVERNLTNYDYSKKENPTPHDRLFNYFFTTAGLSQLKPDFLTKIKTISQDFTIRADNYWNSLSSTEQETDCKFKSWYEHFKTEQDIRKKLHLFFALFEIYNYRYELQCPGYVQRSK